MKNYIVYTYVKIQAKDNNELYEKFGEKYPDLYIEQVDEVI